MKVYLKISIGTQGRLNSEEIEMNSNDKDHVYRLIVLHRDKSVPKRLSKVDYIMSIGSFLKVLESFIISGLLSRAGGSDFVDPLFGLYMTYLTTSQATLITTIPILGKNLSVDNIKNGFLLLVRPNRNKNANEDQDLVLTQRFMLLPAIHKNSEKTEGYYWRPIVKINELEFQKISLLISSTIHSYRLVQIIIDQRNNVMSSINQDCLANDSKQNSLSLAKKFLNNIHAKSSSHVRSKLLNGAKLNGGLYSYEK